MEKKIFMSYKLHDPQNWPFILIKYFQMLFQKILLLLFRNRALFQGWSAFQQVLKIKQVIK